MLFQASNPSQQSNVGSSLPCSHQQQSDQEQDTHTLSCFNIITSKFELLPIPTSVAPLLNLWCNIITKLLIIFAHMK